MVADSAFAPAIEQLPMARDAETAPVAWALRSCLPPEEPNLALHTSLDIGPQRSEDSNHPYALQASTYTVAHLTDRARLDSYHLGDA